MRWTDEARAKQAMMIRKWEPWKRSTGPRTKHGKNTTSLNAFKHGYYSAESKGMRSELFRFLQESQELRTEYNSRQHKNSS